MAPILLRGLIIPHLFLALLKGAQAELRRLAAIPKILSLGPLPLTPSDILSEPDPLQVLTKVMSDEYQYWLC